MTERDVFEPRSEPARTLYRAFQEAAAQRTIDTSGRWHLNELHAVFIAANVWAFAHGRSPVTMETIIEAETYAAGHADYGAKWAYRIVDVCGWPREVVHD